MDDLTSLLGSLTPEQRAFILQKLPDFTGQEQEAEHQQSLANALRIRPTQRMDAASQIARAVSGAASGYQQGAAGQTRKALGEGYGTFGRQLAELLRKKQNPTAMADPGDDLGYYASS